MELDVGVQFEQDLSILFPRAGLEKEAGHFAVGVHSKAWRSRWGGEYNSLAVGRP